MDNDFSLSIETVLLFVAILFLAFCCGFLRSLKRIFGRRENHLRQHQRNILVTHINIPRTISLQNEGDISSVYPSEDQVNPPPYSALSNILPPSYDDVIKQNAARNESVIEVPKLDTRF